MCCRQVSRCLRRRTRWCKSGLVCRRKRRYTTRCRCGRLRRLVCRMCRGHCRRMHRRLSSGCACHQALCVISGIAHIPLQTRAHERARKPVCCCLLTSRGRQVAAVRAIIASMCSRQVCRRLARYACWSLGRGVSRSKSWHSSGRRRRRFCGLERRHCCWRSCRMHRRCSRRTARHQAPRLVRGICHKALEARAHIRARKAKSVCLLTPRCH